jgi:hypothetical protein
MTTLVTQAQIDELRKMVDEPDPETYSDDDLTIMVEKYPMIDELGQDPYYYTFLGTVPTKAIMQGWIPTYNLNMAAADVWEHKAAQVAGKYDFSADGGQYSRSQAYNQAMQMAKYYRGRGGATTVKQIKKPDETYYKNATWIGNLPEPRD